MENNTKVEPHYFNRELSLLEFNRRVLEEAVDNRLPLLERVKFLSIFNSNLDEFFMIRVAGVLEQIESELPETGKDGLTPPEQIARIHERVLELQGKAWELYRNEIMPELNKAGIYLYDYAELSKPQKDALKVYFDTNVYPVLTPLAVDPAHPFPHISNLSLSLAVVLRDRHGHERFARVKIPQVLPRLVPVEMPEQESKTRTFGFVWLEQVTAAHLQRLFKGMEIVSSYAFRVIRDSDLDIDEDEVDDLLVTIENSLSQRRFGVVTQLVVQKETPENIRNLLVQNLEIDHSCMFEYEGPLAMRDIMSLYDLELPVLKDPPFRQHVPSALSSRVDIFESIRQRDIIVHHPYDSFMPVVDLVRAAANDPDVLAIKQTIYRAGTHSPIVEALAEASDNGKQVSVLVELKARFDEENNIEWARALENSGVHVVYGDIELKTHCKVLLVVRKENDGIRRYVHLGTGNYNAKTARLYVDLGLFTCHPKIGEDVSDLFNSLTGYSVNNGYQKLLVSPNGIRQGLEERIEREIENVKAGHRGHMIFKTNSLTDYGMAEVLYRASQGGVKVELIVRGSCVLVPGVQGLSENITVTSIVGQFLEHDRIYYFYNQGKEEVWLGSADLMPRNLDRRVETVFPVLDKSIREWVVRKLLPAYLKDNQKARVLQSDGSYLRKKPAEDEPPFNCQSWFLEHKTPVA